MNRKLYSRSGIFSIIIIFSIVFLLAGCCIFGGKKGEKKPAEPIKEEAVAPAPSKPLAAAKTSDESDFESDKLDQEVETVNGVLNWSEGFIRAKGFGVLPDNAASPEQGKLMAFRAAYADALANLLEMTNGVSVTATTTVKDYVVKDHTIELKVAGIVKGSKEVKRVFDADKNVAIVEVGLAMEDLAMGIPKDQLSFAEPDFEAWEVRGNETLRQAAGDNEELAAAVESSENLDEIEQKLEKMARDNEALASRNEELLVGIQLLTQEIGKLRSTGTPASYTGVVVNAAGSGVKPNMAPNIYYLDGDTYKLLYGLDDGRARDANAHVLAVWERTLTGASDNERVTRTPFVVNATHLAKEQAALAISAEDAKMVEKINEGTNLLEDGRVVIVH